MAIFGNFNNSSPSRATAAPPVSLVKAFPVFDGVGKSFVVRLGKQEDEESGRQGGDAEDEEDGKRT